MSGHSKWSKIKHQKGTLDIKRGQTFTKVANAIIIAVKQGGGVTNPEANFRLRLAIEKGKAINMPKENIERAIKRALGKTKEGNLEEVTYEGYGPGGVALLINAVTDNRQRTTAAIKNILENSGGNLAGPGAVAFNFKAQGLIVVKKDNLNEEKILEKVVASGANDFEAGDDIFLIYTDVKDLMSIKEKLANSGLTITLAEVSMEPQNLIPINDKNLAERILLVIKKLEQLDDVLKVYANFDIPDELIKQITFSN